MSESIRVRLQFDKFCSSELRNCLLSVNKKETKDVKSLKKMIEKRHHLPQDIVLLIDGFVLDDSDKVDGLIRDNDIILVEPKVIKSDVKIKTEKPEEKLNVSEHKHKKSNTSRKSTSGKPKSHRKSEPTKRRIDSDDDSDDKKDVKKVKIEVKSEFTPYKTPKTEVKEDFKDITLSKDTEQIPETKSSQICEPECVVSSSRNLPVRKAFQNATTSLKQKPQPLFAPSKPSTSTSASETAKPKPKKKKPPREATEPVDRFSPIIILNRCQQPIRNYTESQQTSKKQSARKTFPNSSRIKETETNGNQKLDYNKDSESLIQSEDAIETIDDCFALNTRSERSDSKNSIDIDSCQPLTSFPNVGDVIAFKMLTISDDGTGYVSSPFKVGSVINVTKNQPIIDILLHDVLKRNNLNASSKNIDEPIHSLKIDWSTIFEPKLIQKASDTASIEPITID